jgi:hypothetical protein
MRKPQKEKTNLPPVEKLTKSKADWFRELIQSTTAYDEAHRPHPLRSEAIARTVLCFSDGVIDDHLKSLVEMLLTLHQASVKCKDESLSLKFLSASTTVYELHDFLKELVDYQLVPRSDTQF